MSIQFQIHFQHGNKLLQEGKYLEATNAYKKALSIKQNSYLAWGNLGATLWILGESQQALHCYRMAKNIAPDNLEILYNYGGILYQTGDCVNAERILRRVISLDPYNDKAYIQLGNTYYEQGKYELAQKCYKKVVGIKPSGGALVRYNTAIPIFPSSVEDIHQIRHKLDKRLGTLTKGEIYIEDPIRENCYTNFFLAYHGICDKALQVKFARLYHKACPTLNYMAPHCIDPKNRRRSEKIRIGFISRYFEDHSIGNTSKGLIAKLSRADFEVIVLSFKPLNDKTGHYIDSVSDKTVILPSSLNEARDIISNLQLDILFYQDIGMDPFTYFLAFSRLAPIQCTTFGHPDTTGIPAMDYFISAEDYETDVSHEHYSEKLVCLRGVSSCAFYYKPELPAHLKPRHYFGLNNEDHLYICPQTLFKFHPEFDEILRKILHTDPKGKLILIEGKHKHWSELLLQRLTKENPEVEKRIIILPRQSGSDFINLIAVCDVMLDTIHFCGQNTSHQGFSAGIPIVTMPGDLHRSRHTLAFYKQMKIMDCVAKNANDYVDIAVRLGTDISYRKSVVKKLVERRDIIWEDENVINEFEQIFKQMISNLKH